MMKSVEVRHPDVAEDLGDFRQLAHVVELRRAPEHHQGEVAPGSRLLQQANRLVPRAEREEDLGRLRIAQGLEFGERLSGPPGVAGPRRCPRQRG